MGVSSRVTHWAGADRAGDAVRAESFRAEVDKHPKLEAPLSLNPGEVKRS
jgi:hypothetical protein